jgi:hypothetical protein
MLAGCGGHHTQLFVADGGNNHILVYDAPFVTGQSAVTVLGQAAFNTAAVPNPPTAASMARPNVMIDTSGTLYVSDANNCRVLQFKPPFTTGMNAILAIGQATGAGNLTSNTCLQGVAATASGLDIPVGLALDSAGNLWAVVSG